MNKVFIQSNDKQYFGALVAKFAIERNARTPLPVEIINSDRLEVFKNFVNVRGGALQSFTLTRFMPPELMGYMGKAIVIDPDIFALADLNELFALDMQGKAILACTKKGAYDSSVMVLDCAKLKHWKSTELVAREYDRLMSLVDEPSVGELSRVWNDLDHVDESTKMFHTTVRLTQPWKTGLPIDFTRKPLPKFLGIIPREPILGLLGRYPSTYQPHPDKHVEETVFGLMREAYKAGVLTDSFIQDEIKRKHIRPDMVAILHEKPTTS